MKDRLNNLDIYCERAAHWWHEDEKTFKSLRSILEYRWGILLPLLPDLKGKLVADLGCGGGLLSARLASAGAYVFGIDQSERSIESAINLGLPNTQFQVDDIRSAQLPQEQFDLMFIMDVLEHIDNYHSTLLRWCQCLKPNGKLIIATIHKSRLSTFLSISLAENLFGLVPKGTHDPSLFIDWRDLVSLMKNSNFGLEYLLPEKPKFSSLYLGALNMKASKHVLASYVAIFKKGQHDDR